MPGFGFGFGARKDHRGFQGKAPPTPDVPLSPSASWNGTAGSGFAATPSDPVRVTAKPTCHLIVLPAQFFSDELVVGVAAWANNNGSLFNRCGLRHVTFHFEGESQEIAQPGFKTISDANGISRSYYGWWVTLKKPAGVQGEAQLYVEAEPLDNTMQNRMIGPYSYFPHEPFAATGTLHDYELEVAPSQPQITGQRYTDVRNALNYLRAQKQTVGVLNPRLTFTEGGTMDMTAAFWSETIPGWITCEATQPITFSRDASQRDQDATFRPRLGTIRWMGANITFDFANAVSYYTEANDRVAFDGVTLTNSRGREALYRKGPPNQSGLVRSWAWFAECTAEKVQNPFWNAELVRGCTATDCINDAFVNTKCVIDTHIDQLDNDHLAVDVDALSVHYTGAGSAATLSGDLSSTNRAFTAKVDGATVGTFNAGGSLFSANTGTHYDVQDVADWLNGLAGWSATVLDDSRRAISLSTLGNRGQDFFDVDVKSAPLTLATHFDFHSDWYQQNVGTLPENVLVANSTGVRLRAQGTLLTASSPDKSDYIFVNNALSFKFDNPTGEFANEFAFSQWGRGQSHVVFAHCSWAGQGIYLRSDFAYTPDSYCLFANCVARSMEWVGNPVPLTIKDCHLYEGASAVTGATGTTTGGSETTLFVDFANGDFEPAGALLTYLKPPTVQYDRNKILRSGLVPLGSDVRSSPALLSSLIVTSPQIDEASPQGTDIAQIAGLTLGSTLVLADDAGGRFALSGQRLVAGPVVADFDTQPSHQITLRETLAGAKNSPRDTLVTISVIDLPGVTLEALSLVNADVAEDAPQGTLVGNLQGQTAGSTLTLSDSAGGRFALQGSSVVTGPTGLDFEEGQSHAILVQESLAEGINSPAVSSIDILVGPPNEAEEPTPIPLPKEPENSISYITTVSGGRDAELGMPDEYWREVGNQEAAMDMSLTGTATRMTVQDGHWSEAATWMGGTIPAAGEVAHVMHEVIYDASTPIGGDSVGEVMAAIEADDAAAHASYAPFALKGVMVMTGARLRFDPARQTFLLTENLLAMGGGELEIGNEGNPVLDSGVTHNGLRVPRAAIGLIGLADPGASARLGMITMGKLRMWGEAKTEAGTCAEIAAGQKTITMNSAPVGWRVGDRILIPGTAFTPMVSSDSRYTGPSGYFGPNNNFAGQWPDSGNMAQFTADSFKTAGEDEIKVITAISGNTVTVDSAFAYDHDHYSGARKGGQTLTLKFPVQNFTRSICVFGFCTDEQGSGAHRRAHSMHMFHDDAVRKWARFKDLGRSRIDGTLWSPGLNDDVAGLRTNDGGALLADSDNVIGRYAVHDHFTGPYFYRRAVINEGLVIDSAPGTVSPGRGYVQHASRAHVKGCIAYGHRATAFWTEFGSEIGQWEKCYGANCPGDGMGFADFSDRHELIAGHSGHYGVAFMNQARQIILKDCWAGSSQFQFNWHPSRIIPMSPISPHHMNLRLADPLAQGMTDTQTYHRFDLGMVGDYGHHQPQIPSFDGNTGHNCEIGFYVNHRVTDKGDVMPMFSRGFLTHARKPYWIPSYSFHYSFDQFLFVGDGTGSAIDIETKSVNFSFVDGVVRDFDYVIRDKEFNYLGELVDIVHPGVALQNTHQLNNLSPSVAGHSQNGIMGAFTDLGGDSANVRTYVNVDSDTDLPVPRPGPAWMPADPAPGSPTPRYHLAAGAGGTLTPTGRNQVTQRATIVDSLGPRDWPSSIQFTVNGSGGGNVGDRSTNVMTGAEIVERNGCWNDAGTWRTTLWFLEGDRRTHEPLSIRIDCELSGFDQAFLDRYEVANAAATQPQWPPLLEDYSYSSAPSVETRVLPFTLATFSDAAPSSVNICSTIVRVDRLSPGQSAPISIASGEYRVNGGSWTAAAGNVLRGDEVEVRATASPAAGASVTATLTIGAESANFTVVTESTGVSSISDDFLGDPDGARLADRSGYTLNSGDADAITIEDNGRLTHTNVPSHVLVNDNPGRTDNLRFVMRTYQNGCARFGLFDTPEPESHFFKMYQHWNGKFRIEYQAGGALTRWEYDSNTNKEVTVELIDGRFTVRWDGSLRNPNSGPEQRLPAALGANHRVMLSSHGASPRTGGFANYAVEHI